MRWYDRVVLVVLAALFVMLIGAGASLAAKVEATADHGGIVITTPPTTICVAHAGEACT